MWRETHRWRGFPSTLPFIFATGVHGTSQGHTPTSYTLNCDEPAKAKNDACDAVVSIRCREGRTAEPGGSGWPPSSGWFLFAVAKGVQRNAQAVAIATAVQFLFAVAKGVQRNA